MICTPKAVQLLGCISYCDRDAFLVLKDILAQLWFGRKNKKCFRHISAKTVYGGETA